MEDFIKNNTDDLKGEFYYVVRIKQKGVKICPIIILDFVFCNSQLGDGIANL